MAPLLFKQSEGERARVESDVGRSHHLHTYARRCVQGCLMSRTPKFFFLSQVIFFLFDFLSRPFPRGGKLMFSLLQMSERYSRKPLRDLVRFFSFALFKIRGEVRLMYQKCFFLKLWRRKMRKKGGGFAGKRGTQKALSVIYSQNGKKGPPSFWLSWIPGREGRRGGTHPMI